MTDRLADIEERLDNVEQLSTVVSAIRGIAAARLREADEKLEGIKAYTATIAEAIGQALLLLAGGAGGGGGTSEGGAGRQLVIALCSEQGFVGGFNAHVLDEVERVLAQARGPSRLFLVGDRGLLGAAERDLEVAWSVPMAAHADEVLSLANRLTERLYAELPQGQVQRVLLVHAIPAQGSAIRTVTRPLIPFDFERFQPSVGRVPPLFTLPPQKLLESLAEEYVFAEICEAAMLGYAAENEARMYAMLAAHENVERKHEDLGMQARRVRQNEITAEVIELSSGVEARRSDSRRA